jgi:phosphatidylserine decarboxylase
MPSAGPLQRFFLQEDLNFLLTNRIPRRAVTLAAGRVTRIEQPQIRDLSLALWQLFSDDLCLHEAETQHFRSLHEVFVRRLRPGARPIDPRPEVLTSPCDAIVGACGRVRSTTALQAKGFDYRLEELLPDPALVERHRDGLFVTLRLKSDMYHRFHAPCEGSTQEVTYISGDTWNVNPIALQRVEQLFCKNERCVLPILDAPAGVQLTLVPVAAIVVASMRIHGLEEPLNLRYKGPNRLPLQRSFKKGDELGYFECGSTILVFANGPVQLADTVREGQRIRVGEPLFSLNKTPS